MCITAILTFKFFDFNYFTNPSTIKGIKSDKASVVDLDLSREGWWVNSSSIDYYKILPSDAEVDFNSY